MPVDFNFRGISAMIVLVRARDFDVLLGFIVIVGGFGYD